MKPKTFPLTESKNIVSIIIVGERVYAMNVCLDLLFRNHWGK
jgi:hypothetical protein